MATNALSGMSSSLTTDDGQSANVPQVKRQRPQQKQQVSTTTITNMQRPLCLATTTAPTFRFAPIDSGTASATAIHVGAAMALPMTTMSTTSAPSRVSTTTLPSLPFRSHSVVATAITAPSATTVSRRHHHSSSRQQYPQQQQQRSHHTVTSHAAAATHSSMARSVMNKRFAVAAAHNLVNDADNDDLVLDISSTTADLLASNRHMARQMAYDMPETVERHYAVLLWKSIQRNPAAVTSINMSMNASVPDLSRQLAPTQCRIEFGTLPVAPTLRGVDRIERPQPGSVCIVQCDTFATPSVDRPNAKTVVDTKRFTLVVVGANSTHAVAMPCVWLNAPPVMHAVSAAASPLLSVDDDDDSGERIEPPSAHRDVAPLSYTSANTALPPRLARHASSPALINMDALCLQVPPLGQTLTFCTSGFEMFNLAVIDSSTTTATATTTSAAATTSTPPLTTTSFLIGTPWRLCTPNGTPLPHHSLTWQHVVDDHTSTTSPVNTSPDLACQSITCSGSTCSSITSQIATSQGVTSQSTADHSRG